VAALRTVIVAALAVDSAAEAVAASMVAVAAAVSTVEAAATAVVDTGNSGLVIPGRSFRLTAEN
jgi:hypothetical protein